MNFTDPIQPLVIDQKETTVAMDLIKTFDWERAINSISTTHSPFQETTATAQE